MRVYVRASAIVLCLAVLGWSEVPVAARPAELSIPFGSVHGALITVGDYLVFYDADKPESSFGVRRDSIRKLEVQGEALTAEVSPPVRVRNGERTSLAFRIADASNAAAILEWSKASGAVAFGPSAGSQTAASGPGEKEAEVTYEARHKHRFGGCNGRLIVKSDQVVFESIDDIDHSRQWSLRDIKELKRDNPYSFKVVPFSGSNYDFELHGSGMDSDVYRELVSRVTAARVAQ